MDMKLSKAVLLTGVLGLVMSHPCKGFTWQAISSGTTDHLTGLAQSQDITLVLGGSSILTTDDGGQSWFPRVSPSAAPLRAVARGAGRFVAVGDVDTAQGSDTNIFSSTNGVDWIPHSSGSNCSFINVRYLDGRFIALGTTGSVSNLNNGNGVICTSTDGIVWNVRTSTFPTVLLDVAFGNERLVAVGPINVAVSVNRGLNWTQGTGPTGYLLRAIDFKDGRFLAVRDANPGSGEKNLIYQTYDGVTWKSEPAGTVNPLADIKFLGDLNMIVGANGNGNLAEPGSMILTSSTRGVWKKETVTASTRYLRKVARTTMGYVAVGDYGTILFANVASEVQTAIKGTVTLEINSTPFTYYQLQESADMVTWSDVGAPFTAGTESAYQKLTFDVSSKNFFRVVVSTK